MTARVATTATGILNTSFENGDTIDGIALVTGDTILIKNQTALAEIFTVTCNAASTLASTGPGDYFLMDSTSTAYYVWYNITDGTTTDPAVGGRTAVQINVVSTDIAALVATGTQFVIDGLADFSASVITNVVTVTVVATGSVPDAADVNTGFVLAVTQQGTDGKDNGLYTVNASGAPSRNASFNVGDAISGETIFIKEGSLNAFTIWTCTNAPGSDVVGTNALTFARTSIPGAISASSTDTVTNKTISSGSNTITLDTSTLTSGTLGVVRGGTGAATLASGNVLVGNGTSAVLTTKAAPSGDFVGTTDSQTLSSKTLTATTNTVRASELATTGASVVITGAAPPSTDQILRATSATTATWQTTTNGLFGSQYQFEEDAALSTTTSTAFVLKLNLTTPSLPAGTYRISWYYTWYHTVITTNFLARVQIDDTTTIHSQTEEPQDPATTQRRVASGFYTTALTAAVHSFDLDFATSVNTSTSGISNTRLEIFRIS